MGRFQVRLWVITGLFGVSNLMNISLSEKLFPYFTSLHIRMSGIWMEGWMNCKFTCLSTVFQSYQDDGTFIMKGCVQWNSFYG